MIDKDGHLFEKDLKTGRWSVLGRDGLRVVLELDEFGYLSESRAAFYEDS
ncbi:hypothetical protein LINGRAHAP2_LOCUS27912, partial [Linum grandiflorum]